MGPLSRIIARYALGYVILPYFMPQEIADIIANDPDTALAVGIVFMGVVEGAYALAKKLGWAT